VNPKPIPVITYSGSANFCLASDVKLSAGNEYNSYQWYKDGDAIGGAIDSIYMAGDEGVYTVLVSNKSCSGESAPVSVTGSSPVTISADKDPVICSGDAVTLSTGSASSYQWKIDGDDISGASGQSYSATKTGEYSVYATDAFGCSALSGSIVVTVKSAPSPEVDVDGETEFCAGGYTILSTGEYEAYRWKRNGVPMPGATYQQMLITATGFYTVTVTNENGCLGTAAAIEIVVNPLPDNTLSPSGAMSICSNEDLILSVPEGASYQWVRNEELIENVTGSTLQVVLSGTYKVYLESEAGCKNVSPAAIVFIKQAPEVPVITFSGTSLTSTEAFKYKWFKNGAQIAEATSQELLLSSNGAYYVVTSSENGCSSQSETYMVTNLSEDEIQTVGSLIQVFPNPIKDGINIVATAEGSYRLYDMSGRLVTKGEVAKGKTSIEGSKLSPGIYNLMLDVEGKSFQLKMLK